METITLEKFIERLKAQGVPRRHLALICPVCKTVQSFESLIRAGAGETEDEVEKFLGFSCVGRWTNAGPGHGAATGRGCDWTLGGLLQLHELKVVTPDGVEHPRFVPATAEQAQELMSAHAANAPAVADTA